MKKWLCLILLVFVTLTMTSCSHIEDTNGEDNYAVETIRSYEVLDFSHTCIVTGSLHTRTEKSKYIKATYSASKMSGIYTLEKFKWNTTNVGFNIKFDVLSGNAMLVMVYYGEVIKEIQANSKAIFGLNSGAKYWSIYLVGESARVNIEYIIQGV